MLAAARPIPEFPPVTSATFPLGLHDSVLSAMESDGDLRKSTGCAAESTQERGRRNKNYCCTTHQMFLILRRKKFPLTTLFFQV
jgi:hypothetical protein